MPTPVTVFFADGFPTLGVKLVKDGHNLKVVEVFRSGSIMDWNRLTENTHSKVQVNDFIRAVNGKTGPDRMLCELSKIPIEVPWLELVVVRGEPERTPGGDSSAKEWPPGTEWF